MCTDRLAYVIFCLWVVTEFVLFWRFAQREIVWAYPNHHDQLHYLFRTYEMYTHFMAGRPDTWLTYLHDPPPQGILFPIQGFLLCLLFGASRLTCLAVNFIWFVSLQTCLLATMRWFTGKSWCGLVCVGLVLSQITAFYSAGGLFDYRIDFLAYCLYGMWILTVLRSRVFAETGWTLISALTASVLMLTRFVTMPYVVGATLLTLLGIALSSGRSLLSPAESEEARGRLRNGGLFLGTAGLLTLPFLYISRKAIWSYYGLLHLTGSEKYIRAAELNVYDLYGHLAFYPKSIVLDHLGRSFLILTMVLFCVAYVLRRLGLSAPQEADEAIPRAVPAFFFLATAIAAPLIVLNLDISKSQVVGGIVGVPVALAVALAIFAISSAGASGNRRAAPSQKLCVILASVSLIVGSWNQFSHLTRTGPFHNRRAEVAQLMQMYDTIGHYVETTGWRHKPTWSANMISDTIHYLSVSVCYFEKRNVLIPMQGLLARNVFAMERNEVLKELELTDILVLGDTSERFPLNEHYPIHETLTPLTDVLEQWAQRHLVLLTRTSSAVGRGYTVYVRPGAKVAGLKDDRCIPAHGVRLTADSRVVRQRPLWIAQVAPARAGVRAPQMEASLFRGNLPATPVPVQVRRNGDTWSVVLDFRECTVPGDGEVTVVIRPEPSDERVDRSVPAGSRAGCPYRWDSVRMERAVASNAIGDSL
jgi:hypothetical protein